MIPKAFLYDPTRTYIIPGHTRQEKKAKACRDLRSLDIIEKGNPCCVTTDAIFEQEL